MVRPTIGVSTSTRSRCAYAVSNRVTAWPARTRCSDRAARNIESPSGIALFVVALEPQRPPRHAKLESHRGGGESGFEQERARTILERRPPVDLFDEPAAPPLRRPLRERHQLARHRAADARSLRLVVRQADNELSITTADPCGGTAIHDHDPGTRSSSRL